MYLYSLLIKTIQTIYGNSDYTLSAKTQERLASQGETWLELGNHFLEMVAAFCSQARMVVSLHLPAFRSHTVIQFFHHADE
jgi:hypothetical protein